MIGTSLKNLLDQMRNGNFSFNHHQYIEFFRIQVVNNLRMMRSNLDSFIKGFSYGGSNAPMPALRE